MATWYDHGIINDLQRHKLVFIETQDDAETSLALLNYMKVRNNQDYCNALIYLSISVILFVVHSFEKCFVLPENE